MLEYARFRVDLLLACGLVAYGTTCKAFILVLSKIGEEKIAT